MAARMPDAAALKIVAEEPRAKEGVGPIMRPPGRPRSVEAAAHEPVVDCRDQLDGCREPMMATMRALFATVLILVGDPGAADANRPPAAQACAVFDVHILTLLEDYGQAAAIPGRDLAQAMTDLVAARSACARGEYDDAFDRYSRIALSRPTDLPSAFVEAR